MLTLIVPHILITNHISPGKSCNVRVLERALTKLKKKGIAGERYEKVKVYHLNPKSIRMGQLYGEFDENTHEWQDGILCVIIRLCIKDDNSDLKWMLFDGPVDAIWIENMNTVLDDNKKLCLTSGEIIQLSEPMTMMFEPEDLAVASPATVSRCGMIYMEPNSLGYDVLLQSWLNTIPAVLIAKNATSILTSLFDAYVPSVLPHMRRNFVEPLPTTNNCLVEALLHLMDTFFAEFCDFDDGREKKTPEEIASFIDKLEPVFLFCMIWSMCCTMLRPEKCLMPFYDQKCPRVKLNMHYLPREPVTITNSMYCKGNGSSGRKRSKHMLMTPNCRFQS